MENKHLPGAIFLLCLLLWQAKPAQAQKALTYPAADGVIFYAPDTSSQIQFGARIQSRLDVSSIYSDGLTPTEAEFRLRRLRLKASGYVIDPRLSFKLELGFSSNDLRESLNNTANILYDAYIQYALSPSLALSFGQFKLPGNRQRVISSQAMALVDRSLLNSEFNLDRDVGLLLEYEESLGQLGFRYAGALTNGEGRNILSASQDLNQGELNLAVTQRVELLPFGWFEGGGDYFEGDLLREETPKLSVGAGYSYNDDAIRERGQRGSLLLENRDINTFFTDFIFKYAGWSLMGEYMNTFTDEPVTMFEEEEVAVGTGNGYMIQGGYVWPNLWGVNTRYSSTEPDPLVLSFYQPTTELLFGVSKYIRGHRIKIQSDIGYLTDESLAPEQQEYWQWRFQMELGL
ncbi:porin [Nafulsella turpanensis]|uniref:porin n=1 Tax=Nafulsella turpanensis TaxID=1265690 RepID=UPI000349696A|nr:porin [Nafulsella turpanensis]